MKRFNLIITLFIYAAISILITACRSSEDKRLDRFLGQWKLESTCTEANPGIRSTLSKSTANIAKAKPDGIWFTTPSCGSYDHFPLDLYLQFDSHTKSYYLKIRGGSDNFLKSIGDGSGDIPLTYSETSGFSMSDQNNKISIEWKGDAHVWTFSHTGPNKEITIQTINFNR
jgi:hypothetical protein